MGSMARPLSLWIAAAWLMLAIPPFASAQQPPPNFVLHQKPQSIAAIAFEDDQGRGQGLRDFKGKVVLLNIWATWCSPCRQEMPALDRLQALLGGPEFEVVPLSIDPKGMEVVRKFYAEVGVPNLAIHLDTAGRSIRELSTVGVPTTLLIDREGRELGRMSGPAEWDSNDIVAFLKSVVSGQSSVITSEARVGEIRGDAADDSQGALSRGLAWLRSLLGR
jgi:thiol-disulfide isomerase/thioredoxin